MIRKYAVILSSRIADYSPVTFKVKYIFDKLGTTYITDPSVLDFGLTTLFMYWSSLA